MIYRGLNERDYVHARRNTGNAARSIARLSLTRSYLEYNGLLRGEGRGEGEGEQTSRDAG